MGKSLEIIWVSWYNEDILDKRVVSGDSCFLVEWRPL